MDRPTAASRHLLETFSHDIKFAFKLQIPILYGMRCLFKGSKISVVIFMNTKAVTKLEGPKLIKMQSAELNHFSPPMSLKQFES